MAWLRAIVPGVAWGCAVLLAAGCAGSGRTGAAAERTTRNLQAAPMPARRLLAVRYLAIAQAGNRRLEHDFDALDGRDRSNLAAADADLRDVAATERLFDRQLLGIAFPPETQQAVRLLITANQARAQLTQTAASSASLRQLRGYQRRLDQANGPVEAVVRVIRSQLGLPPPATS